MYKMGSLDINFRSSAIIYHYSLLQFSWVSKQSLIHETTAEICQFLSYKCSDWFKHSLKYMATFSILWLSVTLQCKSALIKHYNLKETIIKNARTNFPKAAMQPILNVITKLYYWIALGLVASSIQAGRSFTTFPHNWNGKKLFPNYFKNWSVLLNTSVKW